MGHSQGSRLSGVCSLSATGLPADLCFIDCIERGFTFCKSTGDGDAIQRRTIRIPGDSSSKFERRLKNTQVETVSLEKFGHGVTMDPKREEAFKIIVEFLRAKSI